MNGSTGRISPTMTAVLRRLAAGEKPFGAPSTMNALRYGGLIERVTTDKGDFAYQITDLGLAWVRGQVK